MLRNLPRVLHSGCSQFPFPASVWEDSLCSTLTPAFIVCRISAYGHSDQCERWYLMEVLICLSLIFSDVDISSRVFFFKQWELNLFKLASWINIQNIFPVLNIFPMTSPRTFLEGRYFSLTALQALGILSAHEQWFQSCCYGKWPQGGSMLIPNSGYWGNQSHRQNPVPGLSIRMECARRLSRSSARRNAQGLCPIPSCFLSAVPWTQPGPGAALCRVLSSQVWRP